MGTSRWTWSHVLQRVSKAAGLEPVALQDLVQNLDPLLLQLLQDLQTQEAAVSS